MSFFSLFTGRKRTRAAARRLGLDPSAENYLALAREHVVAGDSADVLQVCEEGLQVHPGNSELTRLAERARTLNLDSRVRQLQQDLRISPRPALWKELCEILLRTGRIQRAEEHAESWFEAVHDGESVYYRARCRAELFFQERRAEDGRLAWQLAEHAGQGLAGDSRPLQLQFEIARRCGAWQEARATIARLLELNPGDPDLEARFRIVLANCHEALPLEEALQDVERTGRFVDDAPEGAQSPANVSVRPALQRLGAEPDVHAAVFLRGGTALVQGPHGATADRTARLVREIVIRTRNTCRRMALGRPLQVQMEGDFGVFHLVSGEHGTAALWCTGAIQHSHIESLGDLAGSVRGGA